MNIKLDLKIDNRLFGLIIAILIIVILIFVNYGHPIIEVNHYNNCTRTYSPYTHYFKTASSIEEYEYVDEYEEAQNKTECVTVNDCIFNEKLIGCEKTRDGCNHCCHNVCTLMMCHDINFSKYNLSEVFNPK